MTNSRVSQIAAAVWSVSDLLFRGGYRQSLYGRVLLSFVLLRRIECILEENKTEFLKKSKEITAKGWPEDVIEETLLDKNSEIPFFNLSPFNLSNLDQKNIKPNLQEYIRSFSKNIREIFDHFRFDEFIGLLSNANLLSGVVRQFATLDLSPKTISNNDMGLVFDELVRRFAESSNETAGEHFTPKDIVQLTTALVFSSENNALAKTDTAQTIYDPTAGTGGFLSTGLDYIQQLNPRAELKTFGQELNPESYAICLASLLIKGQDISSIKLGDTLSEDQLPNYKFDYMLSHPPFGFDWKSVQKHILDEHKSLGFAGRFGPGLPRISDGSLLFLMHLISKMNEPSSVKNGARIGVILNESPMFTGKAGSGESEIRRYILESDLLDAIIALPSDMLYNTGIPTYIWIISNNKPKVRKNKVMLIDARDLYTSMRKSLGSKRKYLSRDAIDSIVENYRSYEDNNIVKVLSTTDFGYRRITIDRPLKLAVYPKNHTKLAALLGTKIWQRLDKDVQTAILAVLKLLPEDRYDSRDFFLKAFKDALKSERPDIKLPVSTFKQIIASLSEEESNADICMLNGKPEASGQLRDYENIPLNEDVQQFFEREVHSRNPDAWINSDAHDEHDKQVGVVGYEINFSSFFKNTYSRDNFFHGDYYRLKNVITVNKNGMYKLSPITGKIVDFTSTSNRTSSSSTPRFDINLSLLSPDYYNIFLQQEEGQDWLNSNLKSAVGNIISFSSWLNARIMLPSLANQSELVTFWGECEAVLTRIELLKNSAFNNFNVAQEQILPYQSVANRYEHEFSSMLPTPLAILWELAESKFNDRERSEAFIKFFEYLGFYLISIVFGISKPGRNVFYPKKASKLIGLTMAFSYNRLQDVHKAAHIENSIVDQLCSNDVVEMLRKATTLRNDIAHRGLPSAKSVSEAKEQVAQLMQTMQLKLRSFFDKTTLVKPIQSKFDGSKFIFEVEILKGLGINPSKTAELRTTVPMISGQLYLAQSDLNTTDEIIVSKLFPLMVISETLPESEILGFYFYSDTSNDKLRYVCPYPNVETYKFLETELITGNLND